MVIARASAVILATLVFTFGGAMASSFDVVSVGNRAGGMGGAFRGLANDWSAAYYNPAGYARLYDNQLGAQLNLLHLRNEITPNYRLGGSYPVGIQNDVPQYNRHAIISNPSAGFVVRLPVWGETVFGLSAYQPFDYNVNWEFYSRFGPYNDSLRPPSEQFVNNMDIVAFQLTAAREFAEEKLYLGLGLALLRADLLFDNMNFRANPQLSVDPNWSYAQRPADRIAQWGQDDGYGFGFGVRAGMLWQLSEKASLGLTAFYPSDITVSGESVLEFIMPKYIESLRPVAEDGTAELLLTEGSRVVDSVDFESTIKLPPSVGAGLAIAAGDRLTLTLDGEYTMWSRFDGYHFVYTNHNLITRLVYKGTIMNSPYLYDFFTSDLSLTTDWSNTFRAALGASYDYNESLTILAGAGYDQSPMSSDDLFTPQFVDLGDKINVSGGFEVHIERWDLSLVTAYVTQPDATTETLTDIDSNGLFDSFAGDYSAATYQTSLSFNYRF
jgi:long-chain fatty acid transport protein